MQFVSKLLQYTVFHIKMAHNNVKRMVALDEKSEDQQSVFTQDSFSGDHEWPQIRCEYTQ